MRGAIYIVLLLLVTGCARDTSDSAAAGAMPTLSTAVGPVPGAGAKFVGASNPLAGDPVALQEGRKLFNWYNCSGCHGGHAGGGMGPSLRDQDWLYGNRDDQIFDTIASGRAHGMPSWRTKIPEQQIWKLVAYIKSMRTPQEPDPPLAPKEPKVPEIAVKPPSGESGR